MDVLCWSLIGIVLQGWTCIALEISEMCENVAAIGCSKTRLDAVIGVSNRNSTEICSIFNTLENCYIYKGCSDLEASELIRHHCGDRCDECLLRTEGLSVNAGCLMQSSSSCRQREIALHQAITQNNGQICSEFKIMYDCFLTSGCSRDVAKDMLEEICGDDCAVCSKGPTAANASSWITVLCILTTIVFLETFCE